MEKPKEIITVGVQHINDLDGDPDLLYKQDFTIDTFPVMRSKTQQIQYICGACEADIKIYIYSENIVVKQFWKMIGGLIITIITTIVLYNFFGNFSFIVAIIGLLISLRQVDSRADIVEVIPNPNRPEFSKSKHEVLYKLKRL